MKYIMTVDTNDSKEVVCQLDDEGKPYVQTSLSKVVSAKRNSEVEWHWRIYRIYKLFEVKE